MGLYKYLRAAWKKSDSTKELKQDRLISWREQLSTVRIEKPTRLDRARSLGYKAKQGFIVVRQRVSRGGRNRESPSGGRRTKTQRKSKILAKNYQRICEERANSSYKNCEVLNSYYVGKDGKNIWYEVILIDRKHPQILADKNLANVAAKKGRAFRGLTQAGRRSRGLGGKGIGYEKARPSHRANKRSMN